jgi:hypothetical protein
MLTDPGTVSLRCGTVSDAYRWSDDPESVPYCVPPSSFARWLADGDPVYAVPHPVSPPRLDLGCELVGADGVDWRNVEVRTEVDVHAPPPFQDLVGRYGGFNWSDYPCRGADEQLWAWWGTSALAAGGDGAVEAFLRWRGVHASADFWMQNADGVPLPIAPVHLDLVICHWDNPDCEPAEFDDAGLVAP